MNISEIQNQVLTSTLIGQVENTFKTGCRFYSITYTNQSNEKSRYTLLMGVKMTSLYKSDLRSLLSLRPSLDGLKGEVCDEIISSVKESLDKGIGNNSKYTLKGYYTGEVENKEVSSHTDKEGNKCLYLRGFVISKTVITKGVYKTVKSSEKTLIKKDLEKGLKRGKIRTFIIKESQLSKVVTNGLTVEIS